VPTESTSTQNRYPEQVLKWATDATNDGPPERGGEGATEKHEERGKKNLSDPRESRQKNNGQVAIRTPELPQ
jgi:hypothetical protein